MHENFGLPLTVQIPEELTVKNHTSYVWDYSLYNSWQVVARVMELPVVSALASGLEQALPKRGRSYDWRDLWTEFFDGSYFTFARYRDDRSQLAVTDDRFARYLGWGYLQ